MSRDGPWGFSMVFTVTRARVILLSVPSDLAPVDTRQRSMWPMPHRVRPVLCEGGKGPFSEGVQQVLSLQSVRLAF